MAALSASAIKPTIAIVGLLIAGSTSPAQACFCMGGELVRSGRMSLRDFRQMRLDEAKDVVRGTVLGFRPYTPSPSDRITPYQTFVAFRIEDTIKGTVDGTIELLTGGGQSDCGSKRLLEETKRKDKMITITLSQSIDPQAKYSTNYCTYLVVDE
jgi:hypothetical protein